MRYLFFIALFSPLLNYAEPVTFDTAVASTPLLSQIYMVAASCTGTAQYRKADDILKPLVDFMKFTKLTSNSCVYNALNRTFPKGPPLGLIDKVSNLNVNLSTCQRRWPKGYKEFVEGKETAEAKGFDECAAKSVTNSFPSDTGVRTEISGQQSHK